MPRIGHRRAVSRRAMASAMRHAAASLGDAERREISIERTARRTSREAPACKAGIVFWEPLTQSAREQRMSVSGGRANEI
jgi:hypothetical protein